MSGKPSILTGYWISTPLGRCRQLQLYHQISTAFTQGIVAGASVEFLDHIVGGTHLELKVCMILRTHALCMRDRRILYLLGGILGLGVAVCVVRVSPLWI